MFRVALAMVKMKEKSLLEVPEPLMLFQAMQRLPRKMLDCHALMEACFKTYNDVTVLTETELTLLRKEARELHRQQMRR